MSNEKTGGQAITDDTRITSLDVSVRMMNILQHAGISTIGDVRKANWDVLKMTKNMGRTTWREFVAFTITYGIAPPKATPEKVANQALLDHFAGLAMQALIEKAPWYEIYNDQQEETIRVKTAAMSSGAYAYAQAMIAERTRLMNEKP